MDSTTGKHKVRNVAIGWKTRYRERQLNRSLLALTRWEERRFGMGQSMHAPRDDP